IAPTGEAAVGRDLDQDHLERGDGGCTLAKTRRARVIGNANVMRADVGDFHDQFSFLALARERLNGRVCKASLAHRRLCNGESMRARRKSVFAPPTSEP